MSLKLESKRKEAKRESRGGPWGEILNIYRTTRKLPQKKFLEIFWHPKF